MPALEQVDLRLGEILHEAGGPQKYFYFPGTCIVSLLGELQQRRQRRAVSHRPRGRGRAGAGARRRDDHRRARRCKARALRCAGKPPPCSASSSSAARSCVCCCDTPQSVWTQTAQSALCNRHHSLEQQLCRWLLLSLDRVDGSQIRMTQQLIADMLGVRREGVVLAAKKLQRRGWISYSRGVITVLNRTAMEGHVCRVLPGGQRRVPPAGRWSARERSAGRALSSGQRRHARGRRRFKASPCPRKLRSAVSNCPGL